ncbi:MAG: DUF2272 domain-containing protein [Desulfobacterales bacterium]
MPIQIQNLNLVLCGPILRKVTSHSIAVFIALKETRYIELTLHVGVEPTSDPIHSHKKLNHELISTIALGEHLHVAMVQLDLAGTNGLEPEKLYGYNLLFREINDVHEDSIDLADESINLINQSEAFIGCAKGKLPCFSLPPRNFDIDQFNLIHGSCRKPHGGGKDMLAALDDLLQHQNQYTNPVTRPHLLLFTGDQIYADDVSPPLLRALHDAANALLGWREVFAETAFPGGFESKAKEFQIYLRGKNQELLQILTEAKSSFNVTNEVYTAVSSLLTDLNTRIDQLIPNFPQKSHFEKTVFYVEYASIKAHLQDFKKDQNTWININRDNTGFVLNFLEEYYTKQKALEGYLDFFQDLASDSHWGQIEVEKSPVPIDTSPPESETGKMVAARNRLPKQPIVLSRISPPQRSKELKEFSGMTSDAMDAHLMFLGEFYMMYLFTWSDAIWPVDEYGEKTLPYYWDAVPNYSLFGPLSKQSLIKSRDNTLRFVKSLPKVRRVMANIPTLMIFDDHEVTDDWNLHEEWVVQVNDPDKNVFGGHLLRNALAAYAIFQDWGNQPEDYLPQKDFNKPENPGYQILEKLACEIKSGPAFRPDIVDSETFYSNDSLFDLFGLGRNAYDDKKRANSDKQIENRIDGSARTKIWHWQFDPYEKNGNSFFKLIALDTRTWRGFPDEAWTVRYNQHLKDKFNLQKDSILGRTGPAALIHTKAIEHQLKGLSDNLLNIVISPAPVFGLPLLEDLFQRFIALSGSVEESDYESWQGNSDGFADFREHLKDKAVVLISGDVHYAYTNFIAFGKKTENGIPGETQLTQLCSSSMKNETPLTEALGIAGRSSHAIEFLVKPLTVTAVDWGKTSLIGEKVLENLVDTSKNAGNLGEWWTQTAPLLPSDDQALIRYYLSFKDYSLFNFEMLLPNGAWELGSGIGSFMWSDFLLGNLHGVYEKGEDNQEYVVYFIKDNQNLNQYNVHRQKRLDELENINNLSAEVTSDAYAGHWDEMREIVGFNNIARISFQFEQNDKLIVTRVFHRLYWQIHKSGETKDLLSYTLHDIPLKVNGERWWLFFKEELVRLAKQEYDWWNPDTSEKKYAMLNGKTNPSAHRKLRQYYHVPGLLGKFLIATDPNHLIWGAVFVSYLLKMAQAKDMLPYSERSIDLMRAAKKNRQLDVKKNPFWLYNITEYAPEPGDILCHWREHSFSYQDIDPEDISPMPAQCEVIVEKENKTIFTIGGNINSSVSKHTVKLDDEGKILPGTKPRPDLPGEYIAILKIRTDLLIP